MKENNMGNNNSARNKDAENKDTAVKTADTFHRSLFVIALPVTLQSLLQSSFSVIDQIMIGQMGSDSIAGIGLGGKFASMYSVVLNAVAAAAGIMVAQYIGQKNEKQLAKSFHVNLLFAMLIAAIFMAVSNLFPQELMAIYSKDGQTAALAAGYLRIYSLSFVPMAAAAMTAVVLRCIEAAVIPLVVSFVSVIMNTCLNYLLIFGRLGCPELGVRGAAAASVISQVCACALMLGFFMIKLGHKHIRLPFDVRLGRQDRQQYISILGPILICEFMWSLGENVYAAIYGNIGTGDCAAMTMTGPIQGLMIGALSGLAQAAGIMIGKSLGNEEYDKAYADSRRLIGYGAAGSAVLSVLLILFGRYYVMIYNVESSVQIISCHILIAFAVIAPVKVQNMIVGGGIIRSGGMTKYVMWVDIIGTWIFGVPLGLLAAFVWKLPIPLVYFILSLEEVVRLLISIVIFRGKKWMRSLE